MKITREDLPKREVLLSIELADEDLGPYLDGAYRKVVQRVNIPGFRKGKAPRQVVERFVGYDALLDDAVDLLLPEVVEKAIKNQELEQGSIPKVEVEQRDPVVLKATVPLIPEVTLNEYRGVRVPLETTEVTEEQLNHMLEYLRYESAPWEPADRPVAMGDQVTLDIRAEADSKTLTEQKGVVYLASEGNNNPVPGFAKALVGMKSGDTRKVNLPFPDDYPDESLAGKECTYHVNVIEIKEQRLPDLDDEFAKGVGEGFDNMEALTDKLRGDIQTQEEQSAQRRYEEKVTEQLVSDATIELSELMVEHEIDHMLYDEQEALQRQQIGIERYLEMVGKSVEEHREEVRTVVIARMSQTYALRKLGELEGLTIDSEEVDQEITTLVEEVGGQADRLRRSLDNADGRETLKQTLLRRKALERLVEIGKGKGPS